MYFPQKWPSIGHLDALLTKTLFPWHVVDPRLVLSLEFWFLNCEILLPDVRMIWSTEIHLLDLILTTL